MILLPDIIENFYLFYNFQKLKINKNYNLYK